jgi:hypothetical protein
VCSKCHQSLKKNTTTLIIIFNQRKNLEFACYEFGSLSQQFQNNVALFIILRTTCILKFRIICWYWNIILILLSFLNSIRNLNNLFSFLWVSVPFHYIHSPVTNCMKLSPPSESARLLDREEFRNIYGIRGFITIFTRTLRLSVSWSIYAQSVTSHPISLRYILILFSLVF